MATIAQKDAMTREAHRLIRQRKEIDKMTDNQKVKIEQALAFAEVLAKVDAALKNALDAVPDRMSLEAQVVMAATVTKAGLLIAGLHDTVASAAQEAIERISASTATVQ